MCFSDSRTVYNSQAVSTTYPLWSTRVCRMETCKDHHSTCQVRQVSKSTHIHTRIPLPTSMCFSDSRTVYNSQAVSTTYPLWSTRVCRMETCKDHHSICQVRQVSKYKTENSQHTLTLEYPCQHQCAPQTAGRCITHKRFPQRTHYGVLGSAEWKLARIIIAHVK